MELRFPHGVEIEVSPWGGIKISPLGGIEASPRGGIKVSPGDGIRVAGREESIEPTTVLLLEGGLGDLP